jgi:imidazole glycerol-phosphate synthase subunit HisH
MITIVDYGTGNLRSIANMLSRIGAESKISGVHDDLLRASKIILPGVGHFDFGMQALRKSGLETILNQRALEDQIPVLGICLGAQLLTRRSDEGNEPGLGWIKAETVSFDRQRIGEGRPIPHMGWTETAPKSAGGLFDGFTSDPRFYYVHSFHLRCDNQENELCYATYGYRFVAGIQHKNIVGVQFHPEKSHRFGMQLLRNFVAI